MKIYRYLLIFVMVVLVVGSFNINITLAENWTDWVGKWFKITEKVAGYVYESGSVRRENYSEVEYCKIWGVDESNRILHMDGYGYVGDEGGWIFYGGSDLHVLAGSPSNFQWWFYTTETSEDYVFSGGLAGTIKAKLKNGVLSSATLNGKGSSWEMEQEIIKIRSLTWTGTLIPESKVPVPEQIIEH
jgi:hypothetical protein